MGYQIAHKVACAVSRQNGAHLLLFLSPTSENAQAREGAVEFDCNDSERREDGNRKARIQAKGSRSPFRCLTLPVTCNQMAVGMIDRTLNRGQGASQPEITPEALEVIKAVTKGCT